MSQPLTGQVARLIESRKHTLSPTQRLMLFTLADRIPRGRLDWETTWDRLAQTMVVNPQRLRVAGADLKRKGLVAVETTGRGIVIRLDAKFFSASECSNLLRPQKGQPVAKSYTQSVAKSEVDRPLTIPSKTAPKTPGEGQGGCNTTGACASTSSPPDSLGSGGISNGTTRPLSTSERISLESELRPLKSALKSVRDSYDDHMDWSKEDIAKARQLKTRIAEIKGLLGWKA